MATLHPEGLFLGEACGTALKNFKNGPTICVQFKTEKGQSCWFGSLSKTPGEYGIPLQKTCEALVRMGYAGDDLVADAQSGNGIVGLIAKLKVTHYKDKSGELKDSIKGIYTKDYEPGAGFGSDADAAKAAKTIGVGSFLRAARQKGAAPKPTTPPESDAEATEDIPF